MYRVFIVLLMVLKIIVYLQCLILFYIKVFLEDLRKPEFLSTNGKDI